jgi:hypothetical protein
MAKPEKAGEVKLSKAGKKHLKLLQTNEVKLTGKETEAELEALVEEHGLGSGNADNSDGDDSVEEIAGVPNSLPQQFEEMPIPGGNGKTRRFGIFFVAPVTGGPHKGSTVMYNPEGKRVSPPMSAARIFGRDAEDPRGHEIKTKEAGEVSEYAHIAKACAAANSLRRSRRLPNDPA